MTDTNTNTNTNTDINYCTQCQKHCPETDLKCGRGRRLFGQDQGEERAHEYGEGHEHGEDRGHGEGHEYGHGRRFSDDLYGRMRACGHYLYHGFGRGAGQGKILSILSERESMTQKELQDMLQIQPGSMSELLAKLEEKGLLLRRKDDEDKRRSILALTDAGREAAKERQGEKKPLFDALDEAEQEELKRLLGKLLDSWK